MTSMDAVQVYPDVAGGWRWRRVSVNGKIVATSGEAYRSRWWTKRQARRNNPGCKVVVISSSRT